MREMNQLTQRLDHSVPDVRMKSNSGQVVAFKQALKTFIDKRKRK